MARKYKMDKLEPRPISDLFGEYGHEEVEKEIEERNKDSIIDIDLNLIEPYPQHHFKLPEGEEWNDFVQSIKNYGVLQPIIVREIEEGYQTIAGHSRTAAAKEAGLEKIPAIIIEADDIDASVLVGLTNKQREHISDLEWGWTYRETYELLKKPTANQYTKSAGYHDGNQQNIDSESAGYHDGNQQKTMDVVAQKYGVGRTTIQRKMRLTYIIPEFIEQYEKKKIKQSVLVELSYLSEKIQKAVMAVIEIEKLSINDEIARRIRKAGEDKDSLTVDEIYSLFEPKPKEKEPQESDVKVKVPEIYIPSNLKKREKEEYIIKAVKYVWEKGIEL